MSLPGQVSPMSYNDDKACNHEDCFEYASHAICVENDWMGTIYEYYCDEHLAELHETNCDTVGTCELCHIEGVVLTPIRDAEEGLGGPVYWVCPRCKRAQLVSEQDDVYDDIDDIDED